MVRWTTIAPCFGNLVIVGIFCHLAVAFASTSSNVQPPHAPNIPSVFTGSSSWNDPDDADTIFVGGLHEELVVHDIICCFEQFGAVENATLPLRRDGTDYNRGFAFVRFKDPRSCELAVDNLQEVELAGRRLRVQIALPPHLRLSRLRDASKEDKDSK